MTWTTKSTLFSPESLFLKGFKLYLQENQKPKKFTDLLQVSIGL